MSSFFPSMLLLFLCTVLISSVVSFSPYFGKQSIVPLIPRNVLFGNPKYASPTLSPDGTYLAYLASSDDLNVLNVFVRKTFDSTSARQVTNDTSRGIRSVTWGTRHQGSRWTGTGWIHGGPWARAFGGFSAQAQWFANRGYSTLQVNYRASTGYGKSFLHKGDKQWGVGDMQHDLTDSVQWAIDQGIADPDKVCIYGGSYGGYACLAGLTFTPDLYACGVDIVGPSNVKTLLDSIPDYWAPLRNGMLLKIGDVDADEEFNKKISPLFHVDNIKAPLLIGQGANDPRVKQAEADQIAESMKQKGIPVEYVLYPDEGHGFARPDNRIDFNGRVELFLEKHLGGRAEEFTRPEGTTSVFPLEDR
jgi:acetyl esterase/lipase